MTPRRALAVLAAAPLLAGVTTAAAFLLTGTHRRLGTTRSGARMPLPGDELVEAAVQNDRACTISAPPEEVWPWIAQLGQDKAGFYSFEWLENLVGCRIRGATRIHPEWQHPAPGDPFPLHPEAVLRVAQVDSGQTLVVSSEGGRPPGDMDFEFTWAFHLSPMLGPDGEPATRLHIRERYRPGPGMRPMIEVTSVISAVMTWRMMTRLQALATPSHAARQVALTPRKPRDIGWHSP